MPIFWFCGLGQVLFQPFVLIDQWFQSIIHEIIEFRRETNEMNRTHIEAVHHIFRIARHTESSSIIREIAERKTQTLPLNEL